MDVGVGFDIDHTLCIDNKLERVAFLHLLERVVAEGGTPRGSLAEESDAIDALLKEQRAGAYSIDEAVARFVRERGVEPREAHALEFRTRALSMVDAFIVADPQAAPVLRELHRRGVRVGVLSNGWNPLQIAKAHRAGFHGTILASGDLGTQKPAAAAFARLAETLDLAPAQCWYVGDDPVGDVSGATRAGFRAVWINNEHRAYPPDIPAAANVIGSLAELLTLVPAAAS